MISRRQSDNAVLPHFSCRLKLRSSTFVISIIELINNFISERRNRHWGTTKKCSKYSKSAYNYQQNYSTYACILWLRIIEQGKKLFWPIRAFGKTALIIMMLRKWTPENCFFFFKMVFKANHMAWNIYQLCFLLNWQQFERRNLVFWPTKSSFRTLVEILNFLVGKKGWTIRVFRFTGLTRDWSFSNSHNFLIHMITHILFKFRISSIRCSSWLRISSRNTDCTMLAYAFKKM